ncbi:hypothetical protein C484_01435 [Natrialba taiwanensis DSM 12281]|uniref:DUF1616 domain-containing protein n=1 Tax=Natrialba taiwanensis DSM 12281 TaxID=1230458 RepID=M0AC47_9EURY|nr:hypothetical protein C484_01435 [Natrialba taiwanensis DSM 12281]
MSLVGLVLYFGLGTVAAQPLVGTLSAITLVATLIGAKRRHALPPAERFQPPVERWIAAVRAPASAAESRPAAAIHISVAIVLLLAVSSIGYAVVGPQTGEQFSEVSILTETNDGELVAGNYPTTFDDGESHELVFTVENRERRTVGYTVVVIEQAVENDSVAEQRELKRFETELEHGRTWNHAHDVQPTVSGETVRLAWLVYLDGDVPESPSLENADYSTHRWVEVSAPAEPEEGDGGFPVSPPSPSRDAILLVVTSSVVSFDPGFTAVPWFNVNCSTSAVIEWFATPVAIGIFGPR